MAPVDFVHPPHILSAANLIKPYVQQTPLLESPLLNAMLGFRLLAKAECQQVTGSFKARGAFNQILRLTDLQKEIGVVTFSSGNHAQGVAYAAQTLGVPATIVMPADAPQIKLKNTKAYGAKVVTYDRHTESRENLGYKIAQESGLKLIHPFDDVRTIAGQGTVGREIFEQMCALNAEPDAIIIPCSGGGLAAGIAVGRPVYEHPPALFVAEPEGFDDAERSLASGVLHKNEGVARSNCDALMAPSLGSTPFAILRHHKAKGLVVTEDSVTVAMHIAMEYFKLVVEPGGAVGLAAAFANANRFQGKTVVAVVSGGNVDTALYPSLLFAGDELRRNRTWVRGAAAQVLKL